MSTVNILPPNSPFVRGNGMVAPEWYRYLTGRQRIGDAATAGPVVTMGDVTANYPNSRRLEAVTADIVATDAGAGNPVTLSLADAGTPGTYGDAAKTLQVQTDDKGRVVAVTEFGLNTDNVTEGGSNLYFTTTRAREALSNGDGMAYDDTTGVIAVQPAGTYGAPTGTLSRTTFATYTAPTISAPPTQAEVQALANAVQTLSRTLAALITDMQANGNLS